MKIISILFVFVCFLAASATAQSQSAESFLKQAEKALGDKAKIKAVHNWRKRGLIVRVSDGASGEFQMQAEKPDNFHVKYVIRGFETEYGFNGRSAWMRDSRDGLRTVTGAEGGDLKLKAAFENARWIDWKKKKYKALRDGNSLIEGKRAEVIVLANNLGDRIRLHFDPASYLLIREEIPFGKSVLTFDYSDYRPINGIKQAHTVKTKLGSDEVVLRLDQIEYNTMLSRANFDFPRELGEQLPDIRGLLKELTANEERVENLLENYSFTEKATERELDSKGNLKTTESSVKQISFYKGYRVERLVERNGKPLTENEQTKEDKNTQERIEQIDKEIAKEQERIAKQKTTGEPDRNGRRISIAELLRASSLKNPRREVFQGRNVIVFDFEPDPNFDFKNAKSFLKFFGKTAGVMWIDEEDKQVARLEAMLFDNYNVGGGVLAKLKKGASFTLEKTRFNNEIWLPSIADINLSIKLLLVAGISVNQLIEASNYRRFETQVTDSQVNNPIKP